MADPALFYTDPYQAYPTGGIVVTFHGENLAQIGTAFDWIDNGEQILIGGVPVTDITPIDDTMVTGVIPAHAVGNVDVQLLTGAGGNTLVGFFQYVEPRACTITAIDPTHGPVEGGTLVHVTSDESGFGGIGPGSTLLLLDGVEPVDVLYDDDSSIYFTTPPRPPGTVATVLITNRDGLSASIDFTYDGEVSGPLDVTKYGTHLQDLLPPGKLWNLELDSPLRGMLVGMGDEFARVEARGADLLEEADPRTATETIADWERILGLPDERVTAISAVLAERRVAVTQKLVGRGGQNLAFYYALAAACGYYVPFSGPYAGVLITKHATEMTRSGTMRSGDYLSGVAWAYAITVSVATSPAVGGLTHAQFEAVIRHLTHAHIQVVFYYEP